jgi:hypothetical protein
LRQGGFLGEQKAFNRALVFERVVVEYANFKVVKYRVFGDEFRNCLKHYAVMPDVVCGLVNFRVLGNLVV